MVCQLLAEFRLVKVDILRCFFETFAHFVAAVDADVAALETEFQDTLDIRTLQIEEQDALETEFLGAAFLARQLRIIECVDFQKLFCYIRRPFPHERDGRMLHDAVCHLLHDVFRDVGIF